MFFLVLIISPLGKAGNAGGYSTWDPRRQQQGDHPYQEIPYGDGPGPRGPVPEVPQTYAQLPPVPQHQGWFLFCFVSLVTRTSRQENCEEKITIPPRHDQLSRVVCGLSPLTSLISISVSGGHSMPGQEEDISPYATFHLLGMREEAKAAAAGNFIAGFDQNAPQKTKC